MPCLHAITSLLEKDKRRRIGAAGFDTYTDHAFFRRIDFDLLEKKQIPPVFVPSSEKTNFDATYDLEELLLEEAPLEARARRQKPRVQLKDDATDKEIRTDELHRMIETHFEPFDYTTVTYVFSSPPLGISLAQANIRLTLRDYKGFVDAPANGSTCLDILDKRLPAEAVDDPTLSLHRPLSSESPAGSPPLTTTSNHHHKPGVDHSVSSEYYPTSEHPVPSSSPPLPHALTSPPGAAPTSVPPHTSQPSYQQRGGTRSASKTGGVQVVLDETGSWSDLAHRGGDVMSNDRDGGAGSDGRGKGKPTGMLGFLSRKKGRERSPKPMEKGVLGKEGARVVVGGR